MSTIFAYNSETHVCIPKEELQKLNEERSALYDYLTREGFFGREKTVEYLIKVTSLNELTKQAWLIANRKDWGV